MTKKKKLIERLTFQYFADDKEKMCDLLKGKQHSKIMSGSYASLTADKGRIVWTLVVQRPLRTKACVGSQPGAVKSGR